jgi:hypothetical protein
MIWVAPTKRLRPSSASPENLAFTRLRQDALKGDRRHVLQKEPKGQNQAGDVPSFEHLLLFNEKNLSLGLKKAPLSPESDSDLEWVMQYVRGKKTANLEGVDVFKFLADLALDKAQSKGAQNRVTNDKYLRSEGTSFNDKELRT